MKFKIIITTALVLVAITVCCSVVIPVIMFILLSHLDKFLILLGVIGMLALLYSIWMATYNEVEKWYKSKEES